MVGQVSEINKDFDVQRKFTNALGVFPERGVHQRVKDELAGLAREMEDYDIDDRGDVGPWVREASNEQYS